MQIRRAKKQKACHTSFVQQALQDICQGSDLFPFSHHPGGIHQRKSQGDGGQKAQDVEFFTEPRGEGAGDDVAIGVIQKVKVGVQGLIQEIDGQGRADQKVQR